MSGRSLFGAILLAVGMSVAVGFAVGAWTWFNAPAVGGAWWPYVRAVVTLLAAAVGTKVALVAIQACLLIVNAVADATAEGLL
jgi:hypothetical protein